MLHSRLIFCAYIDTIMLIWKIYTLQDYENTLYSYENTLYSYEKILYSYENTLNSYENTLYSYENTLYSYEITWYKTRSISISQQQLIPFRHAFRVARQTFPKLINDLAEL